ncbi:MAG TPA: TIM barrel protein [Verrucomicrobiae bacterium]|nr:TIM barrel protein [Verrucomicrobiae bacterium]
METSRRDFITRAALGLGVATIGAADRLRAESPNPESSFLRKAPAMRLGMVTYEIGKDWSVVDLIKNCEAAQFEGVELRTTHAHGVEVALSKAQRAEVKKRFADSRVDLMGLGSAFDYHTPDAAKLRKDIDATKEYIRLAADVGAGGVKVRPNAFPKEVPREKTIEQIGRSLREIGEFGSGLGVAIRLEVHGRETSLVPNIKAMLDIADHKNVGACWNSNDTDLAGDGFDANFDLVKDKINAVHMRDLFLESYPFRRLLTRLNEIGYRGFCLAEIPASQDPVRVMRYYRALWLAYQNLL